MRCGELTEAVRPPELSSEDSEVPEIDVAIVVEVGIRVVGGIAGQCSERPTKDTELAVIVVSFVVNVPFGRLLREPDIGWRRVCP